MRSLRTWKPIYGHSYMPDMILASKQQPWTSSPQTISRNHLRLRKKEAEEWHRTAWEESEAKNAKIAEERGCACHHPDR